VAFFLVFLWPGRIPLGKLPLIAGDPGLGKSLITTDMAARVSAGMPWPENRRRQKRGSVILLSAEDDLDDTIRPRLDAAGADVSQIVALRSVDSLRDDLEQLEQALTILVRFTSPRSGQVWQVWAVSPPEYHSRPPIGEVSWPSMLLPLKKATARIAPHPR
jgi:hypothetical protein